VFNIARNGCSAWSDIPAQLGAKQALNFAEIRTGRLAAMIAANNRATDAVAERFGNFLLTPGLWPAIIYYIGNCNASA